MPTRAKGRRYPIEVSSVAWMDLLGYGGMLARVGFDPSRQEAHEAVARLTTFQQTAAAAAHRVFPAMLVNDGVAYFKDLSPRASSVTADFLKRAVASHKDVNAVDHAHGHPGARMIVAVGPRLRIDGVTRLAAEHLANILKRISEGQITAEQAIKEAFKSAPIAGFVPALQANFAFARAYLADEAGSKAGLVGPQCYIDMNFFDDPPPRWITFSRMHRWEGKGMNARFGELKAFDWDAAGREGHAGLRSALEVAGAMGIRY